MKKMSNCFHIFLSAVIGFFMGMIPGKKENVQLVKVLETGGNAGSQTWDKPRCSEAAGTACKSLLSGMKERKDRRKLSNLWNSKYKSRDDTTIRNSVYRNKGHGYRDLLKKRFFWMQGPGDRKCYPERNVLRINV